MDYIKKYFEVFIPGTACNFHCHYCYLGQHGVSTNQRAQFNFTTETMRAAINRKRLGGSCFFNFCADGETMLEHRTLEFVKTVLEEGHYALIITNGTVSNRIDEVCGWPRELRNRLTIVFSFHYLELQRLGLTDTYFENINKIWDAGCSWFSSMVQCEEYITHYDEIKELFMSKVGVLPQLAKYRDDTSQEIRIKTDRPIEEYFDLGIKEFDSGIFKFEKESYMKKVSEFCYAGEWLLYLNLCTGEMRGCYGTKPLGNLFVNPKEKIKLHCVGNNCQLSYCYNGLSRMTMGVIPERKVNYYWWYRHRVTSEGRDTFSDYMKEATSKRLFETNTEYTDKEKKKKNKEYVRFNRDDSYFSRLTLRRVCSKVKKVLTISSNKK